VQSRYVILLSWVQLHGEKERDLAVAVTCSAAWSAGRRLLLRGGAVLSEPGIAHGYRSQVLLCAHTQARASV